MSRRVHTTVILNSFQDNSQAVRVRLKQVQPDDLGGEIKEAAE